MANLFTKKSSSAKLERSLADLRTRESALSLQRGNAVTLLNEAIEARSQNLLVGDLNDTALATKLQSRCDSCASQLKGIDDALSILADQINTAERALLVEVEKVERQAASEKLAQQVAAVQESLPKFLDGARQLHGALTALSVPSFETEELARFVLNVAASQTEIACTFAIDELLRTVGAIKQGVAPIPKPKVDATVVELPKPDPVMTPAEEVETVFVTRSVRYRAADGRQVTVQGWEDHDLPRRLHARASQRNVIAPLTDERRRSHRGLLGGHRIDNPIDLDVERLPPSSDLPEGFEKLDRGPARTLKVPIGERP
jgi:hypothetical protein